MALVVVGSCNVDLVTYVHRWPAPGETIMGAGFAKGWGGKGANQAVVCARLQDKGSAGTTTMIGAVGDDSFGTEYKSALVEEGVVPLLATIPGVPTGVAPIMVHTGNGNNEIVVVPGANACIEPAQLTSPESAAAISAASVLLAQLEVTPAATLAALRSAQAAGALSVLTPAPVPADGLSAALCAATDLLVPNRTEALLLAHAARRSRRGLDVGAAAGATAAAAAEAVDSAAAAVGGGDESTVPMATLLDAAAAMLRSGVGAVCITCGAAGALLAVNGAAFSEEGRRRRMAAAAAESTDAAAAAAAPIVDDADVAAAVAAAVFVPSVRPPSVVDTTGAGDAFAGSCGYFLAQERERARERELEKAGGAASGTASAQGLTLAQLQAACQRAAVVAADSVTRKGTQSSYPRRHDLPAFLFAHAAASEPGAGAAAAAAGTASGSRHWCSALPEVVPASSIHTL